MHGTDIAQLRNLREVVAEYEKKAATISDALAAYEAAGAKLKEAACVGGTWGNETIDTGRVYDHLLERCLLKSAWLHVYEGLNIKHIASPKDKSRFQQSMEKPPEFTLENIRATFGDYIADPRGNILRGLAEVFCDLDPAYKSHDRMRIGVKGLPKRVIIGGFGNFSHWGKDRLEAVINAMAQLQNKPLVTWRELSALEKNEYALMEDGILKADRTWSEDMKIVGRGVHLRRYANGNGHLFFNDEACRDINLALAEYYGEVLPDCVDDEEDKKKRPGTAVSKDLQYYPTPRDVVRRIVDDLYIEKGDKVLEPSCGCGRFMDALRAKGADVFGIEAHAGRANECRMKGHSVLTANFLETEPNPIYDRVVMNPPFYGKHYAKHIEHAMKFLKPDGVLTAILPVTARYDHGLIDGRWNDLPVGAFQESGTNINTTVLTKFADGRA